uniref:Capsid protein n=1 Tax=Cruciviridae sp. TaxID=1955495 RepID=A0A1S6LVG4_9VIRU|nr:capsid protein [Cruciviridae sp.]
MPRRIRKTRKVFRPRVRGRGAYTLPGPRAVRRRFKGRGGYWSDLWSGVKKAYNYVAPWSREHLKPFERLGNKFGMGDLGSALGKITGLGDYKVKKNTLMTDNQVPVVGNHNNRVLIQHREFIQDVLSTTEFQNLTFRINPGDIDTFPWLSRIAQNFEQYQLHGMLFEYKTTSSDALNTTNTALGTVVASTDYNAAAVPFVNKQQMENAEYATSTKPSCSMLHPIECAPSQSTLTKLYVRSNLGQQIPNPQMYDLGIFQLGTVGMQQAGVVIGELWVTYEVEFYKPQLSVSEENAFVALSPTPVNQWQPFNWGQGNIVGSNPIKLGYGLEILNTMDVTLTCQAEGASGPNQGLGYITVPFQYPNAGFQVTYSYANVTGTTGSTGQWIDYAIVDSNTAPLTSFYNGDSSTGQFTQSPFGAVLNTAPSSNNCTSFSFYFVQSPTQVSAPTVISLQWYGNTVASGTTASTGVTVSVISMPDVYVRAMQAYYTSVQ